ncbi:MAG TPA: biosynthetic peptidoglycan transglycosylase [Streptosporangiaceae bacterium]|nr:biosynthetic peptidoglycan transglycosylase [Streptosporangiaceae bacterium]
MAGQAMLPGAARRPRRPGGPRRWVRRALLAICSVVVLLALAAGVLMLITPSVGNAWSIASAQARSRQSAFPGPPVPSRFSRALIATEDHRFGAEPGVDPFAIGRVLFAGLTGGGDQGGATLYQQLAKLLYTPGQGGVPIEIKQIALAIKLKYTYSDPQILRMYEAIVYFGHGFYGLRAASCGYFGRQPTHLTWPQAAVLAGLVQAPSAYDPLQFPGLTRSREQHVIHRLVATRILTRGQAATALSVSIARLTARAGGCHPAG